MLGSEKKIILVLKVRTRDLCHEGYFVGHWTNIVAQIVALCPQITLFDSADLAAAIAYSRLLKLTLFVNGKMVKAKGESSSSSLAAISGSVKQELRELRDRITRILDAIEDQARCPLFSWARPCL